MTKQDATEAQIEQLTAELLGLCAGKQSAVAIGAAMNVIMTSLNYNPSKQVGLAVAYSLRDIANKVQAQANEIRH
ncbi:MAG TPA: hypothetical protein VD999_07620 [Vitreimonas sp.]|nr:hypothetical protein [Vitreimonas sp.]